MKEKARRIHPGIRGVLLFILAFIWVMPASAEETVPVQVTATYGQTEARKMLSMINDFRTGGNAWCWDQTNENKVPVTNLEELQYDYGLEKLAMQRAMELVIKYSHERPNGGRGIDLVGGTRGENIAAGMNSTSTASEAFDLWKEEDKYYAEQGHRRNMLNQYFTRIGIGYAHYGSYHYWVQLFGSGDADTSQTPPDDSETVAAVDILPGKITACSVNPDTVSAAYGASADLSGMQALIRMDETWPKYTMVPVQTTYSWSVDPGSTSVISLSSDGKTVNGLSAGSGTLTTTIFGKTVTATVTVTPLSLASAAVTVGSVPTYAGSAVTPSVTVSLGGKTLAAGTDYTAAYSNNTKPGTAKVTVTGKGNYTGTVSASFTIVCVHSYQTQTTKEPTCSADGLNTLTCSICGDSKTETVPKTGIHEYGAPVFSWSSDYKTASASFTCASGGEKMEVNATVTTETTSTEIIYTAKASLDGKDYTDTKKVAVETEAPADPGTTGDPGGSTGDSGGASGDSGGVTGGSGTTAGDSGGVTGGSGTTAGNPGETAGDSGGAAENPGETAGDPTSGGSGENPGGSTEGSADTAPGGIAEGTVFTANGFNCKISSTTGVTIQAPASRNKTSVSIPATMKVGSTTLKVTAVADGAFRNMTSLRNVSIGKNVTSIGKNAFYGCTRLTKVTGCSGIKSIGSKAFYKCKKLTTIGSVSGRVTLNKAVSIGSYAFAGCSGVKKVSIASKSLTGIDASAFQSCSAMTSFSASSAKLTAIGKKAFYGCKKLSSVTLKTKKLTKKGIGANAFGKIRSTCTFKVPSSKVKSYKSLFRSSGAGSRIKVK